MRVIVHGGMRKTGSSALQEYLATYRSELRDVGIIYPDFRHRGHWLLSAAFTKKPGNYHHAERRLADTDVQAEVESALRKLTEIMVGAGQDEIVILSRLRLGSYLSGHRLYRCVFAISSGK